ncbi:MAG TPA: DUF4268 domain-containing protein [Longimicrobiaceae bacterium]|nr:DUF4268 domain-containing protein [Longimicrobiaceae bacterium]
MAAPIHRLMQDQPSLVTISPDATLLEAVARMIENDFSQLPVVEHGKPFGSPASFITSSSIARALRVFGTSLEHLRVRDALIPARTLAADEDLFSKMDDLLDAYAVLVLNGDGTIAGIVTNHDTTQYFRRRAEDMLLVEDIETTLKDHIRIAYGGEESDPLGPLQTAINSLGGPMDSVRTDCKKSFRRFCGQRGIQVTESEVVEYIESKFERSKDERKFDDLSLSDYIQLARGLEAWRVLGPVFGISDNAFGVMLEGVRKTRNKLMHFRPDITAIERDQLRFCAEWFKNHPPLVQEDEGAGSTELVEQSRIGEPTQEQDPGVTEYIEDSAVEDDGNLAEGGAVDQKYAPLGAYLSHRTRGQERLALSFAETEEIIKASLPEAAREHRSWWENNATTHPQSESWLNAGWHVVSINMTKERVIFARSHARERAFIRFFGEVQSRLREIPDFPPMSVSPIGMNWLTLVTYRGAGRSLIISFARSQRLRLECYVDAGDATENTRIFDSMQARREQMEATVDAELTWERLEGRRACRVALYTPGSITDDAESLERLAEWAVQCTPRFHKAILQVLPEAEGQSDHTS